MIHLAKYTQEDMLNLNQVYRLKEVFCPLDRYLGAYFDEVQLEDGRTVWSMICFEYLCGAIKNVYLILEALKSFGGGNRPHPSSYRPELGISD